MTLTKKVKKELKVLAAKLPAVPQIGVNGKPIIRNEISKGSTLIASAKGESIKTKDKRKVNPDQYYSVEKALPVNHFKNLCRIFELEGQEGIIKYIEKLAKK